MARIDDVLYVDDLTKHSDKFSRHSKLSVINHKKVSLPYSVPVSSTTPNKTASTTPSFSLVPLISPAKGERTPFLPNNNNQKPPRRGSGVKRVLTSYLGFDTKAKVCGSENEVRPSTPKKETVNSQRDSLVLKNGTKAHHNDR